MSKVAAGLSGGVDSTVAAYLLKEQGYDVIGVNVRFPLRKGGFSGQRAFDDAKRSADELGIPFYSADMEKEFKEHVADYFIDGYLHARTPNPCIACNRYVKWEALLLACAGLGADYAATGHYARTVRLANGRYTLARALFPEKDQTYFLSALTQEQLKRTLLPLGGYAKEEVRNMAKRLGFSSAKKRESQDICFARGNGYAAFIDSYAETDIPEGNFVSADGRVLGRHKGITHYTVGQRRGLGLSAGFPVFVTEIREETNEVVVGTKEESFKKTFRAGSLNFMSEENIKEPLRLFVKIRYNHKGAWCMAVKTGDDEVSCTFDEPQFAVTPGQAAVFYDGDYVLAGGVIK